MTQLQIEVDSQTELKLKQISEQEGRRIPDVASRLLARAVGDVLTNEPITETELLAWINQGWSAARWQHYHELVGKRQAETLTPEEHAELIALTNEREIAHARRIEHLIALAKLRSTSLDAVMTQLGIQAPGYV